MGQVWTERSCKSEEVGRSLVKDRRSMLQDGNAEEQHEAGGTGNTNQLLEPSNAAAPNLYAAIGPCDCDACATGRGCQRRHSAWHALNKSAAVHKDCHSRFAATLQLQQQRREGGSPNRSPPLSPLPPFLGRQQMNVCKEPFVCEESSMTLVRSNCWFAGIVHNKWVETGPLGMEGFIHRGIVTTVAVQAPALHQSPMDMAGLQDRLVTH